MPWPHPRDGVLGSLREGRLKVSEGNEVATVVYVLLDSLDGWGLHVHLPPADEVLEPRTYQRGLR